MKKLNQFMLFDSKKFLEGKRLYVTAVSPLNEEEKRIGTKIGVVIYEDKTPYRCAEGETVSNQFEKFNVKVKKIVDVPVGTFVEPINPVGTVFGEFRNNLSMTADDIRILK